MRRRCRPTLDGSADAAEKSWDHGFSTRRMAPNLKVCARRCSTASNSEVHKDPKPIHSRLSRLSGNYGGLCRFTQCEHLRPGDTVN